jgi:hypothetical protein
LEGFGSKEIIRLAGIALQIGETSEALLWTIFTLSILGIVSIRTLKNACIFK